LRQIEAEGRLAPGRYAIDTVHEDQVRRIQAATLLHRLPSTLATNFIVSLSAFALALMRAPSDTTAIWWLCAAVAMLLVRSVSRYALLWTKQAETRPTWALMLISLGAGGSGLVWASLPFILDDFSAYGIDGGLYLMILGVSTGAVMMGVGFRWNGLAFSLPCHLSVATSLALQEDMVSLILAFNVVALTVILLRSAVTSESIFVESIHRKLEATAMTESLQAANSDILDANARLELLANCDPLTGLANRAAFNTALCDGIQQAAKNGQKLSLLVIDLDRFKHVNDTMGHKIGDELLTEFANRLRNHLPTDHAVVARLGGDEFAIIVSGRDPAAEGPRMAEAVLRQGRKPFVLNGQTCMVGTSVGLAIYPDHAASADELFVSADMALYRSKDQGRGRWRKFDPKLRAAAERQRQIEADVLPAIESGQVEAWFQPQVSLDTQRVTGFEALVRWHHPTLGFIAPPEIVAAAHAVHQSERLTAAIADASCRLLLDLPGLGLPEATVAVNVSPREFALYSVADLLDATVARHAIDPKLLEVEITEEALLDTVIAGEQLKRLEQSGFALAVDDFGAGHSSLTRLIDLKVDRLKIDRGIITHIASSQRNQAIVSALIRLGDALSMEMLAEGVETEADAEALRTLGCALGQGYLFARPMPFERIAGWVAERQEKKTRTRLTG
jgi:diguanylate cyclase (GGDEF)-like protein